MSDAAVSSPGTPSGRTILTVRPTLLSRGVLLLNWPFRLGWVILVLFAWALLRWPGWPSWAGAVLAGLAFWGLVRAATARITVTDRTVTTSNALRTRHVVVEPGDTFELGAVELLYPTSRGVVHARGKILVPLLPSVVLTKQQQR